MDRNVFPAIGAIGLSLLTACGGGGGGGGGNGSSSPPPPAATHFSVTAPTTPSAGTAFNLTVTALDESNATITTYSGTVHFTSTDAQGALPTNSSLTNGTGTFQVTLKTPGSQTITATDTVVASITGTSNSIQISVSASGSTATASMVTPRESHRAILLNDGKVFVVGGMRWAALGCPPIDHLCLSALRSAELFDPAAGVFTSTGEMSAARVFHTATLLGNGTVLIAGGDDRGGTTYATAQLFDPATGLFTSTGNLALARSAHTATLLGNGKVLLAGGSGTNGATATAELFDPATGEFMPTGNMTTPRFFHTATPLSDGTVLLAGGDGGGGSTAEIYNAATGTFTPTGSMSVVHIAHTATLLASGEVLVAGGASSNGATAIAELFDPVARNFVPAGSMLSPRQNHTATGLTDGKVLVTGGITGNTALSSAEVFDPATGSFTLAGNLETERYEHTATLLTNGEVLIAGGINFDNSAALNSLATAELIDTGAVPGTVSLSPKSMGFSCHFGVGAPPSCSPPEPATLTNIGSTPVNVFDVVISPANAFVQTNNCPQVLPAGQSCTAMVSLVGSTPRDQVGTFSFAATLYVSDMTADSPQNALLTGTVTID